MLRSDEDEVMFVRYSVPPGDPAVGKTALAQMFRSDGAHFQKSYTLVSRGGRGPGRGAQQGDSTRFQMALRSPESSAQRLLG